MELLLLGSGSADGWPNPWCACPSCQWARAAGQLRARTSALVDGRLLLDPGPDLTTASQRLGVDLSGVAVVLVTHGHPDHLDPAFLLAHGWSGAQRLLVVGPPSALAMCRPWVGPDTVVEFREVAAGDILELAGYRIRVLPAAHSLAGTARYDGTAVLFEITRLDSGRRLLWATDTAELPHAELAGHYDLVALEETFGLHAAGDAGAHLDLSTFAREVARLAADGRVDATSHVVAVHLSHHNPPDLDSRLARIGALAGRDGMVLHAGAASRTPAPGGRVRLVLGGARSGKSRRAEQLAASSGLPVRYVATAPDYPHDPEWQARLAAHRVRRPVSWQTHESADLVPILATAAAGEFVLIDCLTLWLTRLLDQAGAWDTPGRAHEVAAAATSTLCEALAGCAADVVLVSNEVGWSLVPESSSGRLFRDLLGMLNARVAAQADDVELLVAGIPLAISGRPDQGWAGNRHDAQAARTARAAPGPTLDFNNTEGST